MIETLNSAHEPKILLTGLVEPKGGHRRPDGGQSGRGRVRPVGGVLGRCWLAARGSRWRGEGEQTSKLFSVSRVLGGKAAVGEARDDGDPSLEVEGKAMRTAQGSVSARRQCGSKLGPHVLGMDVENTGSGR